MSRNFVLAEAITEKINGADLPEEVTAELRVTPFVVSEEQLRDLHVAVYPGRRSSVRNDRAGFLLSYKPVVVVAQKLGVRDEVSKIERVKQLEKLIEALERALDDDVVGFGFIGFDEGIEREAYDLDMLRQSGCFATAITLEYWGA